MSVVNSSYHAKRPAWSTTLTSSYQQTIDCALHQAALVAICDMLLFGDIDEMAAMSFMKMNAISCICVCENLARPACSA
jgi:hypothetical protein